MRSFLNGFSGGLGRAFGRIVAFILFALLLLTFFNNKKEDIKTTIKTDLEEMIPFE